MEMSKEARAEKNEYMQNWRRKNKDKVRQYNKNFWENKVKEGERDR